MSQLEEPTASAADPYSQQAGATRAGAETRIAAVAVIVDEPGSELVALALADLGGQPLVMWSLRGLRALPGVSSVALLAPPTVIARAASELPAGGAVPFTTTPLNDPGTAASLHALAHLLERLPSHVAYVCLHDVTTPYIDPACWAHELAAVDERTACAAAQPIHDTIKLANSSGVIYATPPRDQLRSLQTPLLVPRAALRSALTALQPIAGPWSKQDYKRTSMSRSPAASWLHILLARLLSAGVSLRVAPAGARSLPLRTAHDLSLAAGWLGSDRGVPG